MVVFWEGIGHGCHVPSNNLVGFDLIIFEAIKENLEGDGGIWIANERLFGWLNHLFLWCKTCD